MKTSRIYWCAACQWAGFIQECPQCHHPLVAIGWFEEDPNLKET